MSDAPIVPGGATTALDMTNERDRGCVRKAIARWPKRWRGVTDELKDAIVQDLKVARLEVDEIQEIDKRVAARVSIAKTVVAIESQTQADDHLQHKTTPDGAEKHEHRLVTYVKGVDEDKI